MQISNGTKVPAVSTTVVCCCGTQSTRQLAHSNCSQTQRGSGKRPALPQVTLLLQQRLQKLEYLQGRPWWTFKRNQRSSKRSKTLHVTNGSKPSLFSELSLLHSPSDFPHAGDDRTGNYLFAGPSGFP